MNLITRLCTVKYWLPLICLVNVFCITAYADVDSGEKWVSIPFKDQKETQLFFSIRGEQKHKLSCRVDKDGKCWLSFKEHFTVYPETEESIAKFIKERKMILLPEKFIDAESDESVKVKFLCELAWDGNDLYVNPECEFKAPLYKPTKITAESYGTKRKTLIMERKIQYYLTLKLPSELEQWDHFKKDLKGTAQMKSGNETITLKYSKESEAHNFTIEKEEDFTLRIKDPFLKYVEIPKDIWVVQESGKSKHVEYAINKLCEFTLKVQLTGKKANKIDSAKLVSKKHGVRSRADKFRETHGVHTAQFINLRYEDLPFQVTVDEQGYFLKPLDISLNDYEDMKPSDPPLLEKREWVVWEYVEELVIIVTDSHGKPMPDAVVSLKDSQNFLKEKIKDLPTSRGEKFADENGGLTYLKVYDWRHSQIEIKDRTGQETIFGPREVSSSDIEITSGDANSVDVTIKIRK